MNKVSIKDQQPNQVYDLLTSCCVPRPLYWAVTQDDHGVTNIAPFSFVSIASVNPAHIMLSIAKKPDGSKSQTLKNIELGTNLSLALTEQGLFDELLASCKNNNYASISTHIENDAPVITGAKVSLLCNHVDTIDKDFLDTYLVLLAIDHIIYEPDLNAEHSINMHGIVSCVGGKDFSVINTIIK